MKKKLAIKSFNFFYDRLLKDVIEFEKVVGKKVTALQSGKPPTDTEEEFFIYGNICLLYNRLASEYENLIIEHGGEVPESVAPKIKKIYSIGEMLNTFQTISEIRKGNYGSPEDWD